jgi:hypothetical protein
MLDGWVVQDTQPFSGGVLDQDWYAFPGWMGSEPLVGLLDHPGDDRRFNIPAGRKALRYTGNSSSLGNGCHLPEPAARPGT